MQLLGGDRDLFENAVSTRLRSPSTDSFSGAWIGPGLPDPEWSYTLGERERLFTLFDEQDPSNPSTLFGTPVRRLPPRTTRLSLSLRF